MPTLERFFREAALMLESGDRDSATLRYLRALVLIFLEATPARVGWIADRYPEVARAVARSPAKTRRQLSPSGV